jgi:2-octaprenyl-3-methyl-6-methoxy-1,4-benzoquinol hydroxylase
VSRRDSFDVAVVGAGVIGSAAALGLAREGLRVAIVEAHPPPTWRADDPDLRVYAIAPDSQALLDALGVWSPLASARAHPYRRMRVWDAGAGGEILFDADAFGRDCLGHIVEHSLLVDRLWAGVSENRNVKMYCPDRLDKLEQDDRDVRLVLEDGREVCARLVLGADGAASRVRELTGLPTSEHDYGQSALVAYVSTSHAHESTCWQRFLPGGPLAFLPCSDGRSSIVWTLPNADARRLLAIDDASFCSELTRAFDARLGEVTGVSARRSFPLQRKLAREMLQGRVALIGDAAHAVHPLAGQGVNLGLRDVVALLAWLRNAQLSHRDFASGQGLRRWARTRLSENMAAAYSFEAINRFFSNDAVLPALIRGPLLGLAGKLPPLAQFFWRRAAGL